MNNIILTTPAMLFPAISLLFLAYTQRFLALANLVRNLHKECLYGDVKLATSVNIHNAQIESLRYRLYLVRKMQIFGVGAFILCGLSMLAMFFDYPMVGRTFFGFSIGSLITSLGFSLREVWMSTKAIDIALSDMES